MIIHAYFTDGFYPWAELFLKSFKFHNGTDSPIILSTRDLSQDKIDKLYDIYSNIKIENEKFNIKNLCKKAGLTKKKLLEHKNEVETKHVTENNKIWKLMVAADDRVKSIHKVISNINTEEKHLLHFDIDMYFRAQLNELFSFVRNHDISIRLRLKSPLNRKTMIGVQGYKINQKSIDFLDRWIYYIDDVKPADRHKGYGQTSCYYAYCDVKNNCEWGNVPSKFISPRMKADDVVWSANTKKGKTKNLELFKKDFDIETK